MSNELYHYGVLGMKWGIRRYQNADGTLTDKGKSRYARVSSQEDVVKNGGKGSDIPTKRREKVVNKYESMKTKEQKETDAASDKAYSDYYKYVADYRKTHADTQTKYEHDYDHTKKGRTLINNAVDSDEVRAKAYAGAEWYEKYSKELQRAANKDYAEYYRKNR